MVQQLEFMQSYLMMCSNGSLFMLHFPMAVYNDTEEEPCNVLEQYHGLLLRLKGNKEVPNR